MNKLLYLFYILTLIAFALYSYIFIDPNFSYLKNFYTGYFFYYDGIICIVFFLFISLLYAFWVYFYLKIHLAKKQIFRLLLITIGILFITYPAMLSFDIFNYMATAKVTFFYKENPYVIMPIEFTGDPMLAFMHSPNKVALYGPVWILLTGLPVILLPAGFLLSLYAFKLTVVIFYFVCIYLIYRLTGSFKSVLFFAFNPLVLIETVVSGHNDIVMIALALMSIHFLKRKKILSAVVLLFLSIGIKYATVFLLPVVVYVLIKYRKGSTVNWDKIYFSSFILMFIIFLLSPLREEMYPWYAIWFISFASLILQRRRIIFLVMLFSYGLLLRYIPFMYFHNYTTQTKILRTLIMYIPFIFYPLLTYRKKITNV